MVRIFRFILFAMLLCVALSGTAFADEEVTIVGPEEIYAREQIELIFWVHDPEVTKITGEILVDMDHVKLKAIFSVDSSLWKTGVDMYGHVFERQREGDGQAEPVCKLWMQIESVEDGTPIWVTMKNVVLWKGDTAIAIGDVHWERNVLPVVSDDSYLSSLVISDGALSPEFSPYQQQYTATVPHNVGQVQVTAVTSHEGAKVKIDSPELEFGKPTDVTVTVTAEDGSERVYTISVTREDAPDRIPNNNCDLQSIEVADYRLSPTFLPENTAYVLWLPYETTQVEITAIPADDRASVTIVGNQGFKAGQDNLIYVTCTAEDGSQKVYQIIAKRAEAYVPAPTDITESASVTTGNGVVYSAAPEVPTWVYIVVAVAAVTGCAAVGILIADRKK